MLLSVGLGEEKKKDQGVNQSAKSGRIGDGQAERPLSSESMGPRGKMTGGKGSTQQVRANKSPRHLGDAPGCGARPWVMGHFFPFRAEKNLGIGKAEEKGWGNPGGRLLGNSPSKRDPETPTRGLNLPNCKGMEL